MNIVLHFVVLSSLTSLSVQKALRPANNYNNDPNIESPAARRQNDDGKKVYCGPVPFPELSCEETTPAGPTCAPYTGDLGDLRARLQHELSCNTVSYFKNARKAKQRPMMSRLRRGSLKRNRASAPTRTTRTTRTTPRMYRISRTTRPDSRHRRTRRTRNQKLLRNGDERTSSTMAYFEGGEQGEDGERMFGACDNIANCEVHDWELRRTVAYD